MLRHFIIFSLFYVAIHAEGKFAVLQAPNSLEFKGNDAVPADDIGEIISAATGNTINGDAHWAGLSIVDPFNLPKRAIIAVINGATIDSIASPNSEFELQGNAVDASLDNLVSDMKFSKMETCNVDYNSKHGTKTAYKCFNGVDKSDEAAVLPSTKSLDQKNKEDKDFLNAIADLNGAVDNYLKGKASKAGDMKDIVVIRLSLDPLVKSYGVDSAQVTEAATLLKKSISKLQKASGNDLAIVISGAQAAKSRSKRQAKAENNYNLAEYYDSDYPVIFNIILWFMVIFALSLLAISYAIGSMDPGRDSIIYRMTSTRMKKDN